MVARATIALTALCALCVRAQDTSVYVEVAPTEDTEEVEKRYTPELIEELDSTKSDALLLYTEYSARASQSLKQFIRNLSSIREDAMKELGPRVWDYAPDECRKKFNTTIQKAVYTAHRSATFSGENHHKFFLGHMVVFRMHLNKGEEYIKKSNKVISTCGIKCEITSRVKRWRSLAANELNRVRDDLQHSRRMYRDILTHAQRRLQTLRRRADVTAKKAVQDFQLCASSRINS